MIFAMLIVGMVSGLLIGIFIRVLITINHYTREALTAQKAQPLPTPPSEEREGYSSVRKKSLRPNVVGLDALKVGHVFDITYKSFREAARVQKAVAQGVPSGPGGYGGRA